MNKHLATLLLAASLGGCNGLPKIAQSDRYFTIFSAGALYMASATQWNDEYAVTVKHIPLRRYDYACSTGCDLTFFKHKGKAQAWRDARVGEEINAIGRGMLLTTLSGRGRIYSTPFQNTDENGAMYKIHDAPIAKGMSGGPVQAVADGSILGINVGIYSTTLNDVSSYSELNGAKRISVFVPYSVIQREWEIFKGEKSEE